MKYVAAYALLVLGGNATPSEADVSKLLQEVGIEANNDDLSRVLGALKGKDLNEVIAAGTKKLATMSFGGSAAPAGGAGAAAPAKTEAKKEEKKEEKVEEAADVGLGGGLFGDDEEW